MLKSISLSLLLVLALSCQSPKRPSRVFTDPYPYNYFPPQNPDFYFPRIVPPGSKASYSKVHIEEPFIALTFDDGPHPIHTPRLLDILKKRNIKATFYVVGSQAKRYPNILRRIVEEGHEVGNHSYTHPYFTKIPYAKVQQELSHTHRCIVEVTGVSPKTVRPPYGATNKRLKAAIYRDFGYPSILWSVDPQDWKKPGVAVVRQRLLSGTQPGGILLAHDIHGSTVDAMPSTLDDLLRKGYRFVTVTQLLSLDRS